jgi:hypothetical protein
MTLKIGIDVGGVLSHKSDIYEKVSDEIKEIIDMEFAVCSLKELKEAGHELYIVSFCGKNRAYNTRNQLDRVYPGLFSDMFFVKDKKNKNEILRHKGIDVFIDDTLSVLQNVTTIPKSHLIHYTEDISAKKLHKFRLCKDVKRTEFDSWDEMCKHIMTLKPLGIPCKDIDISSYIYT